MSFACRARRFHILRSFYNTSQVIKPLLLQVDYKMVRQTLAFLVLFIVVTLQSAQIKGYSFWKLCVGVCVGPIPFWVPGCQRLCWALSYQGAHSMPALAQTFFSWEKRCFLSMVKPKNSWNTSNMPQKGLSSFGRFSAEKWCGCGCGCSPPPYKFPVCPKILKYFLHPTKLRSSIGKTHMSHDTLFPNVYLMATTSSNSKGSAKPPPHPPPHPHPGPFL